MSVRSFEFREKLPENPLRVRAILGRHGIQAEYNGNGELTEVGVEQIRQLGLTLSDQFKREGNRKRIRVFYSNRVRTEQSAFILDEILQQEINTEICEIYSPKEWDFLHTADAIAPLLDDCVPSENVCSAWLNLSGKKLKEYGAISPSQIRDRLCETVKEWENLSRIVEHFEPNAPELNIIGLSHEPLFWGAFLLNKRIDITQSNVMHAQYIQIDVAHGDKPTSYKFRGEEFYPNGTGTIPVWNPNHNGEI